MAGGIPVLGTIAADLAANEIARVRGIVNGTTNYILTAMAQDGRPYDEVLQDAQELGYAEADPAGDVEGDDAVNKLVILARLAFGRWLDPASVGRRPPTARGDGRPGITGVTDQELEGRGGARADDQAARHRDPSRRRRSRRPSSRRRSPPTARSAGPTGSRTGSRSTRSRWARSGCPGPGAGGPATSSAILGDLVAIARGLGSTWAGLPAATGPAVAAADPLDGRRHWFAFLPAVRPGPLPAALDQAAAVGFEDGTAIRSEVVTLAEAKAAFDAILPDGVDVTLYPVDD